MQPEGPSRLTQDQEPALKEGSPDSPARLWLLLLGHHGALGVARRERGVGGYFLADW